MAKRKRKTQSKKREPAPAPRHQPMRIAFLTPEFVTTTRDGGGLASYLDRMTAALRDAGHEPEVFTLADKPGVVDHHGMRVEHVVPSDSMKTRLLELTWRTRLRLGGTVRAHRGALGLAEALERRHRVEPFEAVQSSDWGITGYYVLPQPGRTHVVRCSWSRKLYEQHGGHKPTMDSRILARHEQAAVRRADAAYAPSRHIAFHLYENAGIDARVIRPPMMRRCATEPVKRDNLPKRYMMHLGQLSRLKGTDVLAEALPMVWKHEPDFAMIWAGRESQRRLVRGYTRPWWPNDKKVRYLGPLPRPQLHDLLKDATAAVLPSRCDNLPNTVIESLSLNVPVIGTRGSSIDELVADGRNGRLVPIGDTAALAEAMLDLWRKPMKKIDNGGAFDDMQPEAAVNALIELIRNATQRTAQAA